MSDTHSGGEKCGRRRGVERMTRKLMNKQGMSPADAERKARKHALRVERGAVKR